jgi:hypothetical protein
MAFECKHCGRRFVSEESLTQHSQAKHFGNVKTGGKINFKKYTILFMIGLIVVFSVVTVYSRSQKPGAYDEFTKCLTEKGVVMYGNDYCSYTGTQLNYFGKSDRHLNYVKCSSNQGLCDSKGVEITPTWEFEGEMYDGVQTFERLSALTGCEI